MMNVGVMQPYFFPYIGYWQLICAVDTYVLFDDVNYIKRGWINRNRILCNGDVRFFNVYLNHASQNKKINEILINDDELNDNNIKIIYEAYRNAPFFSDAFPVIENILSCSEKNLARFNGYLIKHICDYLKIKTNIIYSSEIKKNNELKGQDKIISICNILGATDYINAIGGMDLYDEKCFFDNHINLHFLKTKDFSYKQFDDEFHGNLSIIDVMMFNSVDTITEYLSMYELIEK